MSVNCLEILLSVLFFIAATLWSKQLVERELNRKEGRFDSLDSEESQALIMSRGDCSTQDSLDKLSAIQEASA